VNGICNDSGNISGSKPAMFLHSPVVRIAVSKSFGERITCDLELRYLRSQTKYYIVMHKRRSTASTFWTRRVWNDELLAAL